MISFGLMYEPNINPDATAESSEANPRATCQLNATKSHIGVFGVSSCWEAMGIICVGPFLQTNTKVPGGLQNGPCLPSDSFRAVSLGVLRRT